MFIVEIVTLVTSLLQCIGSLSEKLSCCANLGACTSFCACSAALVMYILGSYWRFSHPGAVCSGAGPKGLEGAYNYIPMAGLCIKVVLIIFYVALGLVCCIVPIILCCCATALGLAAAS